MEDTKTVEGPFLYITQTKQSGTHRWVIYPVQTVDGKIQNFSSDTQWQNFEISAYFSDPDDLRRNPADYQSGKREPAWGWDYGYRSVYHVDVRDAERMLKTLKAVGKSLEAQANTYGTTQTFVEYVMRLAVAIRAKKFITSNDTSGRSYTDTRHQWHDARSAQWYLNDAHREHVKSVLGEEQAA